MPHSFNVNSPCTPFWQSTLKRATIGTSSVTCGSLSPPCNKLLLQTWPPPSARNVWKSNFGPPTDRSRWRNKHLQATDSGEFDARHAYAALSHRDNGPAKALRKALRNETPSSWHFHLNIKRLPPTDRSIQSHWCVLSWTVASDNKESISEIISMHGIYLKSTQTTRIDKAKDCRAQMKLAMFKSKWCLKYRNQKPVLIGFISMRADRIESIILVV